MKRKQMKTKRLKRVSTGLLAVIIALSLIPTTNIFANEITAESSETESNETGVESSDETETESNETGSNETETESNETGSDETEIGSNEIGARSNVMGAASSDANEIALNTIIEQRITDNAAKQTDDKYNQEWQKYLDGEYKKVEANFSWNRNTELTPWSGATASQSGGDPSDNPLEKPTINAGGYVEVYFGEQLMYALENTGVNKKIKIMSDIDLAGYDYAWTATVNLDGVTIDGNNKIIYNLGATKSFIDTMKKSTMENITFDCAKLASKDVPMLGIVGNASDNDPATRSKLSYARVQNSLIFSAYPTYTGMQPSYTAPFAESKNITADHVASANNIVYAVAAHAGGTFGVVEHSEVANSYSIDSTVIAGNDHSGGFISCSDGAMDIQKCFTNNTVYGNKSTGVFIGAILPNYLSQDQVATFENCFTSGTIEGTDKLGGFIGLIEANSYNVSINFKNCYSTSIVGMRQGGTNLGGFLGCIQDQRGKAYSFENCYAAGEVGAIDIDVSASRAPSSVGGFIGSFAVASANAFTNCYYDKQTTAMREWETGDTSGASASGSAPSNAGAHDYIEETTQASNNISGIQGVLTSDSEKFGAGLASLPNANYTAFPSELPLVKEKVGFAGFTGDNTGGGAVTNTDWIYDGGNTDPDSHNCMYPQLGVFYNSDDTLVRAYSYASVSTVHEQVWDHCTHGGPLDRKAYDTVRDLTMRFTLTSYVDNASKGEDVNIVWEKSDAISSPYGEDQQVIGMYEKINSSQYNREYWTADKFAPGTEWVNVNFGVSGADGKTVVGKRRLRIIPTSNIEAGNDHLDITVGSEYNHGTDAYFAYSTAQRMATDPTDITTGVYPDAFPFAAEDPRSSLQVERTLASGTTIEDLFALYDDEYQVSAEFMSNVAEGIGKPHKDNIINTYIYDVKKFNELTDKEIAEIIYIEDGKPKDESAILSPTLLENGDAGAKAWADKFNGKKAFEKGDEGRYLIEYEWIRTDGRFARDAKMVMVQPLNHNVAIEVKNFADDSVNEDSLQLSAVDFDGGATRPATNFGADTECSLDKTVEHFKAVDLAFKNVNEGATIKKIKFEITTSDLDSGVKSQTVTVDPVTLDTEFSVPISYYYSSYEEGGKYYAKKATTDRKYSLKYDAANAYYYLTMNNEFIDQETGFTRSDLESDVKVTVYVEDKNMVSRGGVTIINKTFDNEKETNVTDTISYTIKDNAGNVVETFALDSKANNEKAITRLKVGEYTIERANSSVYDLQDITVDSNAPVTTNVASFDIVRKGDTQIVIRNVREITDPDPKPDPDPTPDPDPKPGPDPKPSPGSKPGPGVKPTPTLDPDKGAVKTGDITGEMVGVYAIALMMSLLIVLIVLKKRTSR